MSFAALSTRRIQPGTALAQVRLPQTERVTLEHPATAVMTDLSVTRAATVAGLETLAAAETIMVQNGVRLLFVVSKQRTLAGVVTLDDLRNDRPLIKMHERNVARHDVTVEDVMTPVSELDVLDFKQLSSARVGDVVATFRALGDPYLLITERGTPGRIRGLVSRNQVERQLGESLGAFHTANTFAEIRAALA